MKEENVLKIKIFLKLIGILGRWYSDESWAPSTILDFIGDWAIWVLIMGILLLALSSYYVWLTRYYMDRFEEIISTNSKKEFQKNWTEIEQIARYQLPNEYRKRVAEARKRFGLR